MNAIKIGKSNPILKDLKDLYKKNNTENLIIIEDINSLEIALKNNISIYRFFYSDDIEYHKETKILIDKASSIAQESYEMSKAIFDTLAIKSNSVGFIALAKLEAITFKDIKNKEFILVADRIETPGNLGTIYRTMDSAKCEAMILVDPITKITNPTLALSSRGTNLIIPTVVSTYEETLKYLIDNDYDIFLGEPELGLDYQSYDYKGKIAIVVGNERFGINPDWYNHKNKKVFIPMEGNNNSLNVSVAASILIYEAYMKRKKAR